MRKLFKIVFCIAISLSVAMGQSGVRCGGMTMSKAQYDSIQAVEKDKRFLLISDTTKSIVKFESIENFKNKWDQNVTERIPFVDFFLVNSSGDTLKSSTGIDAKCYLALSPGTFSITMKYGSQQNQPIITMRFDKGHFYTFCVDLSFGKKPKSFGLLKNLIFADELTAKKDLKKE